MRNDEDDWDLTTGVGATAAMVAAARAVASRHPKRLMDDPFADGLVHAVGIDLFSKIVDGEIDFAQFGASWFPEVIGIRARFIDEFLSTACEEGLRQVVILASGLDCRAYYLPWPTDTVIFEVDQPAVVEWKKTVLASLSCESSVEHHAVGIDLRRDWSRELRRAGFNPGAPTIWIAEGLLIGYLPASAQNLLLDTITGLSTSGSRIAADYFDVKQLDTLGESFNNFYAEWQKHDTTLDLRNLTFPGPRADPGTYLAEHGWTVTYSAQLRDFARGLGRSTLETVDLPEITYGRFFSCARR